MLAIKASHIIAIIIAFSSSGCASTVTAWKNDPLQSYEVLGPSVYAMTGDRRTAVFTKKGGDLRYCAESLPDAVAAFAASSSAKLKAEGLKGGAGGEAGVSDQTAVGLLQTFQRTEIAEVSRQLGFNTCLAWSQGAITDAQYHDLLEKLVSGSIDVMKTRASQPLTPSTPATIQVVTVPVAVSTDAAKDAAGK